VDNKNIRKSGFTLVEILVAAAVLSIFTLAGYKVFIAMSRSFQKGSWSLATQNKLRNGLNFIREEMQKATYRTDVMVNGTTITDAGFELNLNNSDKITDGKVAEWYICLPFVSGDINSPGAIFKCELKISGGKLLYSKGLEEGSDPLNKEKIFSNYKVLEDVSELEIIQEDFDPDNKKMGSLITFVITVKHYDQNQYPEAHVINRTGAKVEVGVLRTL